MTDLGSAIYASSKNVKQFPIAIKFMVIRTNPGKLGNVKQVIAVHIDTDFTKASICQEMLFCIYHSGNKNGYPLGIEMQFAPNTADIRQPVTIHTRQNVKILKNKKRSFWLKPANFLVAQFKGSLMSSQALESPYDKLLWIFAPRRMVILFLSLPTKKPGAPMSPSYFQKTEWKNL
jgi:hypothetical protein